MKKVLAILLAGMMTATAFAGCGGSSESSKSDSKSDSSSTESKSESKGGGDIDPSFPDASLFGDETDITLKVWAPDKAVSLVKEQVKAFQDHYSDVKFKSIEVVAQGESDAATQIMNDNTVVKEEDAKTFEGVLTACKNAGKQFIMDSGNGFYSCTFAFTGGALIDGFEDDGITQKFVDFDEDECVKTLQAFAKLMKDYKGTYSSQDPANISTGFKNGKVGAGVDGTWNSTADKDALGDKFGAAPLPTIKVGDKDKQLISLFGYKFIGVNSHTKFQRSAQILAYYLTGLDCQKQRAEKLGWGPSNTEAQKAFADDPILKAVSAQSENAVAQVKIAGTFWTPMGSLGSEMYKDSWDPSDAAATKTLLNKVISAVRDE